MTAFIRTAFARTLVFLTVCGGLSLGSQIALNAQQAEVQQDPAAAQKVRDEFMVILRKYSPSVRQVLKLDPSLLSSEQYMAPYPAIVAFLNQHPEVRKSPAYYFQPVQTASDDSYYYDPRDRAWERMMDAAAVVTAFLVVGGTLAWLVRTAVDYRRWGRLAKVQAEAHTKLLDRFTGNDELLAYVQSPAGSRFLKSSPISLDGNAKTMAAPFSRILWSMQVGLVMSILGLGLNYVSRTIDPFRAEPVFVFSVVALSVGIGFIASAAASYIMSKRLGLLGQPTVSEE